MKKDMNMKETDIRSNQTFIEVLARKLLDSGDRLERLFTFLMIFTVIFVLTRQLHPVLSVHSITNMSFDVIFTFSALLVVLTQIFFSAAFYRHWKLAHRLVAERYAGEDLGMFKHFVETIKACRESK